MTISILSPEKFLEAPGAVLLDLDNTLYAYRPRHEAALKQVREKATRLLAISSAQFDALYDRAREDVKRRLGRTAASHSRLLYFQRLIELAGLKTQVLATLDLDQTYWRSFLTQARLFEDAPEFLYDLRLMGIAVVIVTDLTAQIQFRKLVHFGLDHYVDYVVTSEEAGADKPAPAPFDLAMEKLGKISGPIWIVGDDPAAEMANTYHAGVNIQKLHGGSRQSAQAADATFKNFKDLRQLLTKLVAKNSADRG